MAGEKIVMTFPANGDGAKIEAQGYVGGECLAATEPFEQLFKKQVGERVLVGDECRRDPGERVRV